MSFWKTQHFKALQQAWYKRLKDAGFEDAEELVDGEPELKQYASHVYRTDDPDRFSKEEYFKFISEKVQETVFSSIVDRLILESYADGMKIRSICDELEKIGKPRSRSTIRFKIRIYEMKWGLRVYTAKQLNRQARKAS